MTEIKSNADIEPCLSVVMPVFNEAATVAEVIKMVLAQRPVQQLVIVDDCSTDGTWEKLQAAAQDDPRIKLVRHEVNQGKGAALRTGFTHATAPIVIIQDADRGIRPGGISPAAHPDFVRQGGRGVRLAVLGQSRRRIAFCITGIRSATKFSPPFPTWPPDLNLTDMEVCYKVFRREIIQKIKIQGKPFRL